MSDANPIVEKVCYGTATDGLPFAYADGQIIITNPDEALKELEVLRQLDGESDAPELEFQFIPKNPDGSEPSGGAGVAPGWKKHSELAANWESLSEVPYFLVRGVRDPLRAVKLLRTKGIRAHPHHVHFFSHAQGSSPSSYEDVRWPAGPVVSGGGTFTANPAYANPAYANPAYANPTYANPTYANPTYANPAYANPAYANAGYLSGTSPHPAYVSHTSPVAGTDAVSPTQASSAVPAARGRTTRDIWKALSSPTAAPLPTVFVLDTGLAEAGSAPLIETVPLASRIPPLWPSDALDAPTPGPQPGTLAFAAGHGTFIATLVSRVAPKCVVGVGTVLKNSGVGDEWTIASRIHYLKKSLSKTAEDLTRASNSVLNLSFGAPLQDLDEPGLLAHVVKSIQSIGVVVVASAGNDSLSRPSFPAALPDVVSAGSLAPTGPAVFSNYGPWVDACAPGVDIVSVFFGDKAVATDGFHGWAMWSGTSFSSAIVAGAIARLVYDRGISAKEARSILIDAPGLMQLPGLGTVVNVT